MLHLSAAENMDVKKCKYRWMTSLEPWLRKQCIGDVILPGTHNSGSFSITTRNAVIVDKMIPIQAAFTLGLKVDTIMSKFHPRNCIPFSMISDE